MSNDSNFGDQDRDKKSTNSNLQLNFKFPDPISTLSDSNQFNQNENEKEISGITRSSANNSIILTCSKNQNEIDSINSNQSNLIPLSNLSSHNDLNHNDDWLILPKNTNHPSSETSLSLNHLENKIHSNQNLTSSIKTINQPESQIDPFLIPSSPKLNSIFNFNNSRKNSTSSKSSSKSIQNLQLDVLNHSKLKSNQNQNLELNPTQINQINNLEFNQIQINQINDLELNQQNPKHQIINQSNPNMSKKCQNWVEQIQNSSQSLIDPSHPQSILNHDLDQKSDFNQSHLTYELTPDDSGSQCIFHRPQTFKSACFNKPSTISEEINPASSNNPIPTSIHHHSSSNSPLDPSNDLSSSYLLPAIIHPTILQTSKNLNLKVSSKSFHQSNHTTDHPNLKSNPTHQLHPSNSNQTQKSIKPIKPKPTRFTCRSFIFQISLALIIAFCLFQIRFSNNQNQESQLKTPTQQIIIEPPTFDPPSDPSIINPINLVDSKSSDSSSILSQPSISQHSAPSISASIQSNDLIPPTSTIKKEIITTTENLTETSTSNQSFEHSPLQSAPHHYESNSEIFPIKSFKSSWFIISSCLIIAWISFYIFFYSIKAHQVSPKHNTFIETLNQSHASWSPQQLVKTLISIASNNKSLTNLIKTLEKRIRLNQSTQIELAILAWAIGELGNLDSSKQLWDKFWKEDYKLDSKSLNFLQLLQQAQSHQSHQSNLNQDKNISEIDQKPKIENQFDIPPIDQKLQPQSFHHHQPNSIKSEENQEVENTRISNYDSISSMDNDPDHDHLLNLKNQNIKKKTIRRKSQTKVPQNPKIDTNQVNDTNKENNDQNVNSSIKTKKSPIKSSSNVPTRSSPRFKK
ncbi:hypothetical protein O181_054433 [Austropuccinia psidii MF-1]|uniref:Transmembrane protein n=1 Tax=Austropuccinia psidii MF-1 TaxID=1389203 RepID=A0A9Q3HRF0_9BASI|nr:hypothetical protein [Austropuccinia psidii MF-1]